MLQLYQTSAGKKLNDVLLFITIIDNNLYLEIGKDMKNGFVKGGFFNLSNWNQFAYWSILFILTVP